MLFHTAFPLEIKIMTGILPSHNKYQETFFKIPKKNFNIFCVLNTTRFFLLKSLSMINELAKVLDTASTYLLGYDIKTEPNGLNYIFDFLK